MIVERPPECSEARCLRVHVSKVQLEGATEEVVRQPFFWDIAWNKAGNVAWTSLAESIESDEGRSIDEREIHQRAQLRGFLISMVNRCVLAEPPSPPFRVGKARLVRIPGAGVIRDPMAQRGWKAAQVPLVVLEKTGAKNWLIVGTEAPQLSQSRLYEIIVDDAGTVKECILTDSFFEPGDGRLRYVNRFELLRE